MSGPASKKEDVLTLSLFKPLFVLMNDPVTLDGVMEFLTGEALQDERIQEHDIEQMRAPDVVIRTNRRKVLVEVKLDSEFTKSQLDRYLELHPDHQIVALGRSLKRPDCVPKDLVNYVSWPQFRNRLKAMAEESENTIVVPGLNSIADEIKQRVELFDGFPSVELDIVSMQQASSAAAGFFRQVCDWFKQTAASASSEKAKISRRAKRPETVPILEECFSICLRSGTKQIGALIVELDLGVPWTIRVGLRLSTQHRTDALEELAHKAMKTAVMKRVLKPFCGYSMSLMTVDDATYLRDGGELVSPAPKGSFPVLCITAVLDTMTTTNLSTARNFSVLSSGRVGSRFWGNCFAASNLIVRDTTQDNCVTHCDLTRPISIRVNCVQGPSHIATRTLGVLHHLGIAATIQMP